jgi:hypothetical protein
MTAGRKFLAAGLGWLPRSYWPLPPPPPPRPPCGVGRSGCSALLAPAGLFDRVSAPVAAPGPVVGDAVPVDAGPDVAVLGEAPGGEDVVAPVWATAEAAAKTAAEVKRASFVIEQFLIQGSWPTQQRA